MRVLIIAVIFLFSYFYLSRCFSLIIKPKKKIFIYSFILIYMLIINVGFWSLRYLKFNWAENIKLYYCLSWISYTLLGLMLILLSCFFIADFILMIYKIIIFFINKKYNNKSDSSLKFDQKRRSFFHFIALGFSSFLFGLSLNNAIKIPMVKKVFVPILNLHPDLTKFNIVQITDLHIGQTIGLSYVEAIVAKINMLEPDIIVITGDLVDGFVDQIKNWVFPLINLKSKYGVYYVTGNHEYYWDASSWINFIKSLGIVYLENSNKIISIGNAKVVVAGLSDLSADKFNQSQKTDVAKSMLGVPSNPDLKILLAHQPHSAFQAVKYKYYDLQISGHTHGGQMWPGTWLVRLVQTFKPGLTLYKNMWIYVSRGTGYWGPPARLGSDSEITQIYFKQA